METLDALLALISDKPLAQAALIAALSFLAAWVLDRLVRATILRWARRSETDLDDKIVALVHRVVVKSVVLVGLIAAAHRLELEEGKQSVTVNFLLTLLLLIVTAFAFRLSSVLLRTAARQDRFTAVEDRTFPLFDNLAKMAILGLALYLGISVWDVDATGWLASAGIAGLALGFAAQDTLSNLFAGVFIIGDAPYRVGDVINLDSGERGRVVHIGLRSSRILTRDDVEITIPNAVMGQAKITNESGGGMRKCRIPVPVGVAYGSDVDQVREVLQAAAGATKLVCKTPEPRVRFRAFGNSSLDFELLCWVEDPALRGRARDALLTAIYKRFTSEGVVIPFPQRDLWIKEMPARTGNG